MPKNGKSSSRSKKPTYYAFPYVRIYGKSYPLIPISLRVRTQEVNTFALLDSGASISVFRPEIAQALGLHAPKKKGIRLGTASGGVNVSISNVEIKVENTKFKSKIGFSKTIAANFNILGREGFFRHFSICINEMSRTVFMAPLN